MWSYTWKSRLNRHRRGRRRKKSELMFACSTLSRQKLLFIGRRCRLLHDARLELGRGQLSIYMKHKPWDCVHCCHCYLVHQIALWYWMFSCREHVALRCCKKLQLIGYNIKMGCICLKMQCLKNYTSINGFKCIKILVKIFQKMKYLLKQKSPKCHY